jgi:hypothetical protein
MEKSILKLQDLSFEESKQIIGGIDNDSCSCSCSCDCSCGENESMNWKLENRKETHLDNRLNTYKD